MFAKRPEAFPFEGKAVVQTSFVITLNMDI